MGKQSDPGGSWARVEIAGRSLEVTALDGEEKLSCPFRFEFSGPLAGELLSTWSPSLIVGRAANLCWGSGGWTPRRVAGVVTKWLIGDSPLTGARSFLGVVQPRLSQLDWNNSTRFFSGVELSELVGHVLGKVYSDPNIFVWQVRSTATARSHILQAAESDFALLQRTLAREGIYYSWVDGVHENLRLVDTAAALPDLQLGEDHPDNLLKVAPNGQDAEQFEYGLSGFRVSEQLVKQPSEFAVRPYKYTDVGADLDRLRRLQAERATGQGHRLHAWGSCMALRAGVCVELGGLAERAGEHVSLYEGRHLIVAASHRLRLGPGEQECRVEVETMPELLGSKLLRYRPAQPAKQRRPLVMSAEVVGCLRGYGCAESAAAGTARVRTTPVDEGPAQALQPVQRLQPYAGPGVTGAGWYTPLIGGNRVLVSCFDHDPDLPVILGVLPQAGETSLCAVTKGRDGGLKTQSGQGLWIKEAGTRQANGSRITLHGPGAEHLLEFQVGAARHADLVRLACSQGLLELYSHNEQSEISSGERHESIDANDSLEVVSGNASLNSESMLDLRAQAAVLLGAGRDSICTAERHVEINAGAACSLSAERDLHLSAGGDGAEIQVIGGGYRLQAQANIDVSSRSGAVVVINRSRSAGLSVAADGAVRIWGESISLAADQGIAMKGEIEYRS